MPRRDQAKYHKARAEEEAQRAREATDPAVARIHRELSALHRRQLMVVQEVDRVFAPLG